MALDIGDKRIGVALSDPSRMLATPLTIIERKNDAAAVAAIAKIITEKQVARVIAGMPYAPDGGVGQQAQKTQDFAEQLRARLKVPLEFRDERLSTATAQRLIREAATKKSAKKAPDDAIAAAVILQEYLDEGN